MHIGIDCRLPYYRMGGISQYVVQLIPALAAVDAEVFCINLLLGAIIGPRVFSNSISPGADSETVVARFRGEWQRILRLELLLEE